MAFSIKEQTETRAGGGRPQELMDCGRKGGAWAQRQSLWVSGQVSVENSLYARHCWVGRWEDTGRRLRRIMLSKHFLSSRAPRGSPMKTQERDTGQHVFSDNSPHVHWPRVKCRAENFAHMTCSIVPTALRGACPHSHLTDEDTEAWRVGYNTTCHLPQADFPWSLKMSLIYAIFPAPRTKAQAPSLQMCSLSWGGSCRPQSPLARCDFWPKSSLTETYVILATAYRTHLSSRKQEAGPFSIPETWSPSLSTFIGTQNSLFQHFTLKEKKNKELFWLKKKVEERDTLGGSAG